MVKIKKFPKTLATIGLAGGIALSSVVGNASAAQVHYKDVNKNDNFYNSVEFLLGEDAISRTLPNFRPYENITRGQMASILVKVLGLDVTDIKNPKFKDVPSTHQFYKYIAALENEGLISGYKNGNFGVNDKLTRGQMSGILVKAYEIFEVGVSNVSKLGESDIIDHSYINGVSTTEFNNQWSDEMATLYYYNLITGQKTGDKTNLYPNKPINRSQFANMIYQIEKEYVGKYAIVTGEESDKYTKEYNYYISSAVASYPNEFIKYVAYINTGQTFTTFDHDVDPEYGSPYSTNGSYNLLFKVYKEGEIINHSKGIKLIISKDEKGKWKITVEKLEEANSNTTRETDTIH